MKDFVHKELAAGRWFELSLAEQLANIGSEVSRTFKFYKRGDLEKFKSSFERTLELFDLTMSDKRWKGRRKEISRSREVFRMFFFSTEFLTDINKEMEMFDRYFLQFAVLSRRRRNSSG
ncbi:MAG: hypothetical protein N2510_05490 [Ignavibacteria bacterium]|nr:hypothetical protein [Ignavibacteria bacterium]